MTAKDDFAELKLLVARVGDHGLREDMLAEIGRLSSKYLFYKDGFLNGRDSDDACGCRMCTDDEESWIRLDLEEGLPL